MNEQRKYVQIDQKTSKVTETLIVKAMTSALQETVRSNVFIDQSIYHSPAQEPIFT